MNQLPLLNQFQLIGLNTLGLTGAEILLAELSTFPEILALPGQNFIQVANTCYRPHQFEGKNPQTIFEDLSLHQYTRRGHCWAGLTKSMSPGLKQKYDTVRARHCELFARSIDSSSHPRDIFLAYIWSYHQAMETSRPEARHAVYFGNNLIVNASGYTGLADLKVIDFTNPPGFWLAMIGYRMVWDTVEASKFWIVNTLFNRLHARKNPTLHLAVDIEDLLQDPSATRNRIRNYLGFQPEKDNPSPKSEDGFIVFNPEMVAWTGKNRLVLEEIYRGERYFEMTRTLPAWADAFLDDEDNRKLLHRYAAYWNSTVHTNFDWIGPIENEILEKVERQVGSAESRSLSVRFYHDYFHLRSDDFENPTGTCEHYLGMLEEEILLPTMPYYARIALAYMENVARNYLKRPYSGKLFRETVMWNRLNTLQQEGHFKAWAMEERWQQALALFAEAEAAMRPFYPRDKA